jgi:hypothetical protein
MKIPAVAIAAAFAGGILLGRMDSLPSFLQAQHPGCLLRWDFSSVG